MLKKKNIICDSKEVFARSCVTWNAGERWWWWRRWLAGVKKWTYAMCSSLQVTLQFVSRTFLSGTSATAASQKAYNTRRSGAPAQNSCACHSSVPQVKLMNLLKGLAPSFFFFKMRGSLVASLSNLFIFHWGGMSAPHLRGRTNAI